MVAISKLINNGLLLATQAVYQDLATPEQSSIQQYNIIRFLGGSAPYLQRDGFGISVDVPDQCTLEQVQLLSRHGERYPAKSDGANFEPINQKFVAYKGKFSGDLEFLNEYEYFVPNKNNYEKETSPSNSQGTFSGTSNALRHGAAFRAKYNSLYTQNSTLQVFSSNSGRCYQTSNYFARGFLGDDYEEDETVKYHIISEDPSSGVNSLTPRYGCADYNSSANAALVAQYNTSYLQTIADRLVKPNPGLNLTATDVSYLFSWCAYEINVRGASPFCDLFTNEEFIKNSYHTDLSDYYSIGPGNKDSKIIGSTLVNASLALLKDNDNENKIWLSFTHDTDLEFYHSALGLIEPSQDLPVDHIPFPNPYVHSSIVPQGARIETEKIKCGDDYYVRFIINDSVMPIPTCADGPGFSCKLEDYEQYIQNRLGDVNYPQQCNMNSSYPAQVSFYWDYETVTYDAPLGDF